MSETISRPTYAGSLRSISDTVFELTPVTISGARNDIDAADNAIRWSARWLTQNGVRRAILHVAKDGVIFRTVTVESRAESEVG